MAVEFLGTEHIAEFTELNLELVTIFLDPESRLVRFIWDARVFNELREQGDLDRIAEMMHQQADYLKLLQADPTVKMTEAADYLKVDAG